MKFLGLYREPAYSPGRHVTNDAHILECTGQALKQQGISVELTTLEKGRSWYPEFDLIFSMVQGPEGLAELSTWKKQGAFIVNDPDASRRTYRDSLCSMLREKELGFPHSFFVQTDPQADLTGGRSVFSDAGAWLKRADVHATQSGDVVRLRHFGELAPALKEFRSRGLDTAVIQQHCEGHEIKFYGVRGNRFFWPHRPEGSQAFPFNESALQAMADHAAEALGLSIYGGDAILHADGHCTLIDVNDWPSFAPCREAAADAIAMYLKEQSRAHSKSLARP